MACTNSDASSRQSMNSLAERPIGNMYFEFIAKHCFCPKFLGSCLGSFQSCARARALFGEKGEGEIPPVYPQ